MLNFLMQLKRTFECRKRSPILLLNEILQIRLKIKCRLLIAINYSTNGFEKSPLFLNYKNNY